MVIFSIVCLYITVAVIVAFSIVGIWCVVSKLIRENKKAAKQIAECLLIGGASATALFLAWFYMPC